MARHPGMIAQFLLLLAPVTIALGAGCGGAKKPAKQPIGEEAEPEPPEETEADREAERMKAAHAIVPKGSTCLPRSLKEEGAPRLELAAVGSEAVVCAVDQDQARLLGPIGCWTVDLAAGALSYEAPRPLPGLGMTVALDEGCARGYCVPNGPTSGSAHIVWSPDGSKVAVQVGDDVHLFATEGKAHEQSFSIRGDKGISNEPTAIHWVGDVIFVEGADAGPFSAVWGFKVSDGAPTGPLQAIGSKAGQPLSTFGGSFSILDKDRVAIAQKGFSTMTIFEVATGQRAKLVRKLTKPRCKAAEVEKWWVDANAEIGAKCKKHMANQFGYLVGANAVAGSKNLLVLLRGARLGELAVLDARSLAEKKAIKLPWCEEEGGGEEEEGGGEDEAPPASPKSKKKGSSRAEDPDAGGE